MKKILWLLLVSLLVACSAKDKSTQEVSLEDLYQSIDQEIAKINQAPLIHTMHETITKAQREGNKLIITSRVNIDSETYRTQLKTMGGRYTINRLCKNTGTRGLLVKGAEIEYRYILNDNSEVKVNVNSNNCS